MSAHQHDGFRPVATNYATCIRRCEPCRIGASNALGNGPVKYIRAEPLSNIPRESHEGAAEALATALNVRNRKSKLSRFGYSTSEDAVTWVVFTYLLRQGLLVPALRHAGVIKANVATAEPTLLLWGVPIRANAEGKKLRERLSAQCVTLGESADSFSEPDVIVDLGSAGLIIIEAKYLSGNDKKPISYAGWPKYELKAQLNWNFEAVRASGHYELARNWCLLRGLADDRPGILANLGFQKLFVGRQGERLDRFVFGLATSNASQFVKVTWASLLHEVLPYAEEWFAQFCETRQLTGKAPH
jgi:hypothetical protein